jgi:hypothetical protein
VLLEAQGARIRAPNDPAALSATTQKAQVVTRPTAASMAVMDGPALPLALALPTSLAALACAATRRRQVQGPLDQVLWLELPALALVPLVQTLVPAAVVANVVQRRHPATGL